MVTITLVVGALLSAPSFPTEAQHDAKMYRIGMLENVAAAVEGQHFVIEYRSADGRPERFAGLANEFVRLKVDLIVTRGTAAVLSAKQATGAIPIVMATSGEPAAEGVVASLARPGGNITGFHLLVPAELGGRRLQLLKEAVPGSSRIGIFWNPADIQTPLLLRGT